MQYHFSVDDCIKFLQQLSSENFNSVFEHPFLKVFYNLNKTYGAKFRFNLFYSNGEFSLEEMTDRYKAEFIKNSNWLRFSFHAYSEFPEFPYKNASAETFSSHLTKTYAQIKRFAGQECLDFTVTPHYYALSKECLEIVESLGVSGLVGEFSLDKKDEFFNLSSARVANIVQKGYTVKGKIKFFNNNLVINKVKLENLEEKLSLLVNKPLACVMVHEQYFYKDYISYQQDFAEKLEKTIKFLYKRGYMPTFI